ncbi:MAG TPA: trypsin-like peptidase domain-containing protein, partial [Victivallales bacterium]|nr:trypsin-like peptidase domain-containing protein [Victivallales bacterium]
MQLNCRNYKMKRKIVLFFLFLNCFLLFAEERRNEVVKAVEKVLPSVVNIGTETIVSSSHSPWGIDPFEGFFKDFFGHDLQSRTNSLGSGVIIDPAGLIITNAHVVYRATEINIVFYDGKVAKAVEIASDELNDI